MQGKPSPQWKRRPVCAERLFAVAIPHVGAGASCPNPKGQVCPPTPETRGPGARGEWPGGEWPGVLRPLQWPGLPLGGSVSGVNEAPAVPKTEGQGSDPDGVLTLTHDTALHL